MRVHNYKRPRERHKGTRGEATEVEKRDILVEHEFNGRNAKDCRS